MSEITIKSDEEVEKIAKNGKKLGEIIYFALQKAVPGTSTLEIDQYIEKEILNFGGYPSFKKVPGYHWASCVGLNNEVVHSIPKSNKIIKEGDLVKIDAGMFWQGFHTDMSWTVIAGEKKNDLLWKKKEEFLNIGQQALETAISRAIPGNRIGHISQAIEEKIKSAGYQPVVILTGHGIGRELHEEPMIPGVLRQPISETPLLQPGMTLAIEVIYNFGTPDVVLENDHWTVSTKDGKISGLFEKTIAVTKEQPLVLTTFPAEGRNGGSFC